MEHPGKGKGLSELNAKTREMEMEHEVKRLKQVDAPGLMTLSKSLLLFDKPIIFIQKGR